MNKKVLLTIVNSTALFSIFLISGILAPVGAFLCEGAACGRAVIYRNDLQHQDVGTYRQSQVETDWFEAEGNEGVDRGRVSLVEESGRGKVLRVSYPENGVGPGETGAQWKYEFDESYDELYVQYKVKFSEDFDFVRGGKLPGLTGGEDNTGGNRPNGEDGWSARMMWTENGNVNFYVYHPDQPDNFGEYFTWNYGNEQRQFQPGEWHTITHHIVMNDGDEQNGIIQGWFDGELAFQKTDMRFRFNPEFAIDAFYFSTFFGGDGEDWAANKNEYVLFDDFIISELPISDAQPGTITPPPTTNPPAVIPVAASSGGKAGCPNPGPYGVCPPKTDIVIGDILLKSETIALLSGIYLLGVLLVANGQLIKSKLPHSHNR